MPMRFVIQFTIGLSLGVITSAQCWAQDQRRAEALIKACADRQEGTLCDSAQALLAGLPMSDEIQLLMGHAAFARFKIEQRNLLAPAYAAIGEAYYNPSRGYQYIGADKRRYLAALAQEALKRLQPAKKDPTARLSIRELENALDDMALE